MGTLSPQDTLADIEACRRRIEKRSRLNGVYGRPLALLLGYHSVRSYQRASLSGSLPEISLHPIPGQKGKYAFTADLAALVVKRAIKESTEWEELVDKAFSAPPKGRKETKVKISEA